MAYRVKKAVEIVRSRIVCDRRVKNNIYGEADIGEQTRDMQRVIRWWKDREEIKGREMKMTTKRDNAGAQQNFYTFMHVYGSNIILFKGYLCVGISKIFVKHECQLKLVFLIC